MQRRLGSKIQRGILACLRDEELYKNLGHKSPIISTIIDYLLDEGYIKHPDRRRADYNRKMRHLYISVCRSIRNLAKGDAPLVKITRQIYKGPQKEIMTYHSGLRRVTKESYRAIWFQTVELIE